MRLKPGLYLCDNGACYCREHLGATAAATGRDISGQKIYRLRAADLADGVAQGVAFRCERPGCAAGADGAAA